MDEKKLTPDEEASSLSLTFNVRGNRKRLFNPPIKSEAILPHKRNGSNVASHVLEAVNALNHIPSDGPRDEWVTTATAFKAAGGDFDAFDAWSSTAHNYKPNDCKAVWKSISASGGISASTLFYIAQQYGYKSTSKLDSLDMAVINAKVRQQRQVEEDAKQRGYLLAQQRAEVILNQCDYARLNHPYLTNKRIKPALMPWVNKGNRLVIPVMDLQGNLHSLQFIDEHGNKQFLKGGAIKGHFYQLWSRKKSSNAIVICEGYATGVTLYSHYVQDCSVVVAFNAGNLKPVAEVFRAFFPDANIIIAGDCDASGVGQKTAESAAQTINGEYSIPIFQQHETGTDFNDRWCLDNLEVAA